MKVESVVEKMSPEQFDSGCAVDFSEGTLDDHTPKYSGKEMDDVAERSGPFSRALFCLKTEAGVEEPQTTQRATDSVISLRDPCDHMQSAGPNSGVSSPDGRSSLLNRPSCTSTNHSASSQIRNILKVSSDMILFPANDVLNNESSSVSAILPMDNTCKLYRRTSSAEHSSDNRSATPPELQTGTLTRTAVEVSREIERCKARTSGKLRARENRVLPQLTSTLFQGSENCGGNINVNGSGRVIATKRSSELEKNSKERRTDLEENGNGRKCSCLQHQM
jgi:hypothetical protein